MFKNGPQKTCRLAGVLPSLKYEKLIWYVAPGVVLKSCQKNSCKAPNEPTWAANMPEWGGLGPLPTNVTSLRSPLDQPLRSPVSNPPLMTSSLLTVNVVEYTSVGSPGMPSKSWSIGLPSKSLTFGPTVRVYCPRAVRGRNEIVYTVLSAFGTMWSC